MPIFMLFGKYTSQSLKGISSKRTEQAVNLIEKHDGKVISMYAVLGEHDLVFTLDFPDAEKAMAASEVDRYFIDHITSSGSRKV